MIGSAPFITIVRVLLMISLGVVMVRVFFITHEGRKLGRLVKARHPSVWKTHHPMPWPLIMDAQYMGFMWQRKYQVIEEESLVTAFENLRTRLVQTVRFVALWFAIATILALVFA